jgi:hypothetical protein
MHFVGSRQRELLCIILPFADFRTALASVRAALAAERARRRKERAARKTKQVPRPATLPPPALGRGESPLRGKVGVPGASIHDRQVGMTQWDTRGAQTAAVGAVLRDDAFDFQG